jgi:hypothetical protein
MPLLSTLTFGAAYIAFVSAVAFFVVQISIIAGSRSGDNIRIFGIFFILFFSVFFIVKFISMTPKSQVGYNERWRKTLELYLERSGIEKLYMTRTKHYQEARRRLRISIDHYLRESKVLGFFINIVWGGVFIGCLPDKEFQIALITYSPKCIFNANPFGFISLIISPIIFFEYFRRYYLPSAWMEQIVNQIDLLDE